MATAKFEIGSQEKHVIEAIFSPLSGVLKVKLDGTQIASKMVFGSGKISFVVGQNEIHAVDVKASGIAGSKLELFVDDVPQTVNKEPTNMSLVALYVILAIIAVLFGYFGMQWLMGEVFG